MMIGWVMISTEILILGGLLFNLIIVIFVTIIKLVKYYNFVKKNKSKVNPI